MATPALRNEALAAMDGQTLRGRTAGGGFVPSVDYGSMATPPPRADPAAAGQVPMFHPSDRARVYRRGTLSAGAAAAVALNLLLDGGRGTQTVAQATGAFLTAWELLFPGIIPYLGLVGLVSEDPQDCPPELAYVALRARPAGATGAAPAVDDAYVDGLLVSADFQAVGFNACRDRRGPSMAEVYAALAALLYAAHKAPSAVNATAFTQRRPRAAAGAIGQTGLHPNAVPSLEAYQAFAAQCSAGAIRRPLMAELVRWITSGGATTTQQVVVSQIRLARRSGLGGYELARMAMFNYGGTLRRVAGLTAAIVEFDNHNRQLHTVTSADRDYRHLIYGQASNTLAAGDYSDLVMIGKEIARTAADTMVNFGRRLHQDLVDEILRVAAADGVRIVGMSPAVAAQQAV